MSKILEFLIQMQQGKDQQQNNSIKLQSEIMKMMELLKRMNDKHKNQESGPVQFQDQIRNGITLLERLEQKFKKIHWFLGILGIFSILSLIINFI